ncbi:MAG: RNA polymerase subunit sigma-70 [Deltaproteobacteria bacterium CG11_big_fil_rev_8_21_14_0_20_49_13]|nr:MAG: RNA polymerase subunit sigma-70 [Deltaproteobacteria bacterium CG11_big_fil_rev_8_21_14_0_20_49_13]
MKENNEKYLPTLRHEPSQLVPVDPLKAYLSQVAAYPMLSEEEEKELARRFHEEGDVEAAKKLVTSHLRLVVKIAMEYKNAYHNVLDLIGEGNVGLMHAVKKFDTTKGARLGHYATWWIRSYILKYILDNFRLIKIGTTRNQRKLFFNLMQEKQKIEQMGYYADSRLLSSKLGVDVSEIEEMSNRLTHPEIGLGTPVSHEPKSAILEDFISDDEIPMDEKLSNKQMSDIFKERLEQFSKVLKPREVKILHERLLSEVPLTLQEIANEYGISKERARQIEARLMEKLKGYFNDIRP